MLTDINWGGSQLLDALGLVGGDVVMIPAPIIDSRTVRMIENALRSSRFIVLVGPPGTGKGTILADLVRRVAADPSAFGFSAQHQPGWPDPLKRTPDDSWTSFDVVGGYAPRGGTLDFIPGTFLAAIAEDRWVILDELNRGELDKIFGPLLTWLADEDVDVIPSGGLADAVRLEWDRDSPVSQEEQTVVNGSNVRRFRAGTDWRLLGTFNPQDAQRVFGIGQALGRRFRQIPVPPVDSEQFIDLLGAQFPDLPQPLVTGIDSLYRAHFDSRVLRLGPALFLEVAAYAEAAMATDTQGDMEQALAEGYVISIGRYLVQHSEADRDGLAMSQEFQSALGREWAWISSQVTLMT